MYFNVREKIILHINIERNKIVANTGIEFVHGRENTEENSSDIGTNKI